MTEHLNPEQLFIKEDFELMARYATETLAPLFLGDAAEDFKESFVPDVVFEEGKGEYIPTVAFREGKLHLTVEAPSIINFAQEQAVDEEVGSGDLSKLLVGAGVARAILAWKTAPLSSASLDARRRFYDMACSKGFLWDGAAEYDDENNYLTRLRMNVERMDDDQVARINVMRFAVGASLNHLSDVNGLQVAIPDLFRDQLIEQEEVRNLNLRTHLAIWEAETAFSFYDDEAPEVFYALSFPMTPAEELTTFIMEKL